MKTKKFLSLILLMLLASIGCREITVTTQVHRDGSFTRTIRITGDSSSVFQGDLPYPVDSTWTMEITPDTVQDSLKNDNIVLIYTKHFDNSEELMYEIGSDTSWRRQLSRELSITSKFGFFYSYPTFREVFQPANPFTFLSYQDFLTHEDLLWLSGQHPVRCHADSLRFDEADKKAEQFLLASITAEIEHILREGIVRLNDPALQPEEVSRAHDSIQGFVESWKFDQPEEIAKGFQRWTGNPAADELVALTPSLFSDFVKKVDLFNQLILMESYSETVEMPGLIIETNSSVLKGSQVTWEIQPMGLLFEPYEMIVESRVVNNWAFIVTGILLVLLVVVLVLKALK